VSRLTDREGEPLTSLRFAFSSWRTFSVALLSFASGLPLGVVWILIPDWMRKSGYDIRLVGLITIAHAPWSFKLLWSPLMDRYRIPLLGRRRGWMALTQLSLVALGLALAISGDQPDAAWVLLALALSIAVASASQDIVIDAYAVDVLRKEEQGPAVGLRIGVYRAAMYVAGALAITLVGRFSWTAVNIFLTLLYLPMLAVTFAAPEPEERTLEPRSLREAVWNPFLGFMVRHRALEILAFVLLYKFSDQLSQSLLRPFLVDMGYSDFDRGFAMGTVGLLGTVGGALVGGSITTVLGLGRSLWIFGFLQIFSNVGYLLIVHTGVNRPLMYGAMSFETLTSGLGMGAFTLRAVACARADLSRGDACGYRTAVARRPAVARSAHRRPRVAAGADDPSRCRVLDRPRRRPKLRSAGGAARDAEAANRQRLDRLGRHSRVRAARWAGGCGVLRRPSRSAARLGASRGSYVNGAQGPTDRSLPPATRSHTNSRAIGPSGLGTAVVPRIIDAHQVARALDTGQTAAEDIGHRPAGGRTADGLGRRDGQGHDAECHRQHC
jgi:MFS family permease